MVRPEPHGRAPLTSPCAVLGRERNRMVSYECFLLFRCEDEKIRSYLF